MVRIYRLLLLLQPKEVRSRYGLEMLQVATERAREHGWCREVIDAIATAVGARQAAFGWILVTAAVVHSVWAASVYPEMTMGVGAVLLTAMALLAGAILARSSRVPGSEPRSPG